MIFLLNNRNPHHVVYYYYKLNDDKGKLIRYNNFYYIKVEGEYRV